MKLKLASAMLVLGCAVAGCGGGGKGASPSPSPSPSPETPAPAPTSVDFTAFSKSIMAAGEQASPSEVESVTFKFDDDDNPAAYDDLLPPGS